MPSAENPTKPNGVKSCKGDHPRKRRPTTSRRPARGHSIGNDTSTVPQSLAIAPDCFEAAAPLGGGIGGVKASELFCFFFIF
jgi:hypothetical protein